MTWLRDQIAPAPHLLEPAETAAQAEKFFQHRNTDALIEAIARQKRAIEHEQAILDGMIRALHAKERR